MNRISNYEKIFNINIFRKDDDKKDINELNTIDVKYIINKKEVTH
jgi:hypothetical protein